ncbi:MAG TPA: biotin/lipoate--protein ligase family protein, partial [Egibacteraceae bacterium]|nr:biotin/lipoate--protein ligase family protein [Egibacteraceae bacterium]
AETDVPDWMIFAVELIAERDHLVDPGAFPDSTSLKEEEFEPAEDILASFASYLMLWFDRWTHQGLKPVVEHYLARLDPPLEAGARSLADGDLVERTASGEMRQETLADGLAACRWRDARGPKL